MTLGALEAEMHQSVHAKFVEPKEQFLKLDMKDGTCVGALPLGPRFPSRLTTRATTNPRRRCTQLRGRWTR